MFMATRSLPSLIMGQIRELMLEFSPFLPEGGISIFEYRTGHIFEAVIIVLTQNIYEYKILERLKNVPNRISNSRAIDPE